MFEAIETLENRRMYSTSSLSSGVLTINGTSGVDTLYVSQAVGQLLVYDGTNSNDGGTSNDRLQGDNGDDTIIGGIGDDHVYAKNAGKDQVDGQDGFDDIRVDVLDLYKNCEDIG